MKKLIYTTLIILFCISAADAQNEGKDIPRKVPTLYGHTFPSLDHSKSSFISTSLKANLGFGITSPLKISGLKIGDHELYSFEGQILFLNMEVEYQQRFNKWLSMNISFSMTGRIGTDMSTILADGVNTIKGGSIGWLFRIKQSKRFNLSGAIDLKNYTGSFISVSKYFEDVINDVPNPRVVNNVPSMSIGGGLYGAYAFSPVFGLQFHGEYSYGESFVRGSSDGFFSVGFLGDADFMPVHNVPVGLAFGYTFSSAPDIVTTEGGTAGLITGKVGYTGSDQFELGIQYTYYNIKLESVENKASVSNFLLFMKFYF